MRIDQQNNDPGTDTILVLGATGITGREVARQLIAAGHKPRLLIRRASRAKAGEFEGNAAIEWDVQSADVMAVLGRPAVSFEDWATQNAAAFS